MMSSYEYNSEDSAIETSENWEENILDMLCEHPSNIHNHQNNVSEANFRYQNETNFTYYSENEVHNNFENNVEGSVLLSPTWEEQSHNNTINMSTYFSTFDPQIQSTLPLQYPVNKSYVIRSQNQLIYANNMEKLYQRRLNLVPASKRIFKPVTKRKRKRTVFTTEQIETLELVFSKKPYVTREERQILVDQLQLSDKSVKVWFQNRRLKGKRSDDHETENNEDISDLEINQLNYVESKICERTNESGYVTLDDRLMTDLVFVIDKYLNKEPAVCKTEQFDIPIYEPISPASTVEECFTDEIFTEKETVQRLIDIESIISV